jgi:hypothetical protein
MKFSKMFLVEKAFQGLTYDEACAKSKISIGVMNKYYLRNKFPRKKALKKLCKAFGWDYKEIAIKICGEKYGIEFPPGKTEKRLIKIERERLKKEIEAIG